MAKWSEELEQYAIEVILEKRQDLQASLLRSLLFLLSKIYRVLVQFRLLAYRKRLLRDHSVGCIVISIGNLTVGGTGKTPVVEKFARALRDNGRRVAILSRGYKSVRPPLRKRLWWRFTGKKEFFAPRVVSDGQEVLLDSRTAGDEPFMLASNLKDVAVIVDKDRVKSALYAICNFRSDTLLLDDGLQYLDLKHRLDIVLIDCQAPFGNEYLLPRGTLREPPDNLRRANYILLTKSSGTGNEALIQRIRQYNRTAEIIECSHKPLYLENLHSGTREDLSFLKDLFIGAVSGIAQPESFYEGLRSLGANLELTRSFTDHHRYTERELQSFMERCIRRDLAAMITTQKDAVRFPKLENPKVPIYILRVEIDILNGKETWEQCIQRICNPHPHVAPAGRLSLAGVP